MPTPPRPHIVEWRDACDAFPTWTPADDAVDATVVNVTSCGFLIQHLNGDVTLVTSLTDDGHLGGGVTIPEGCLVNVKRLD